MWRTVMSSAREMTIFIAASVVLFTPAAAQEYRNPPAVLQQRVELTARAIVDVGTADALDQSWPLLVFYTVADAVGAEGGVSIHTVSPYRYPGESARTDKQLGASASSSGSTTLVQKPGFSEWLAFAVEHGAIERTVSGTNTTISTSPYALIKLWTPDTQENFESYSFWRRLGFSVVLALDDIEATPLENLDLSLVPEVSARVRLLGDRSTRSRRFTQAWDERVGTRIQNRLNANTGAVSQTLNNSPELRAASEAARARLLTEIASALTTTTPPAQQVQQISSLILNELNTAIRDPIRDNTLAVSTAIENQINDVLVPTLLATHSALGNVQSQVDEIVDEVNKSMLATLTYTRHQIPVTSDYSSVKFALETFVAPFNVGLDAGVSLYHDPDEMASQSTVRDYAIGVTVEGTIAFSLFGGLNALDASKTTISASGRFSRLEEADDEIGIAQIKVSIPITAGLRLPISVTYATRTELIDEEEIRGNFGLTVDFDVLQALSQAGIL